MLMASVPAIAQSSGTGQSTSGSSTPATSQQVHQGKLERITAKNLVVEDAEANYVLLSKDRYYYTHPLRFSQQPTGGESPSPKSDQGK